MSGVNARGNLVGLANSCVPPIRIRNEPNNTSPLKPKLHTINPILVLLTNLTLQPSLNPQVNEAICKALAANPAWETMSFPSRAAIFLRAAELLAAKYRYYIMAAVMLDQGKHFWQVDIDAAAETADVY
ncbi:hypothetical protein P170DRAFT_475144 [Aspergillus steynii IBT 23096]|uniref:Aldehyde dehydrogenase domain-containing protein n=1 Tax=Aspergillus steynii IBT 23096 TaxID=1392250 RepID=A0A2I2G7G9_9EURO|nr:uncharacterized protein P170DRAFT_475144 [Aspergillus steynii IBT 23096]PLB48811.1 hypothetical protein P170DRAFT_475144 [Aspergillus steynii IBT 23096]